MRFDNKKRKEIWNKYLIEHVKITNEIANALCTLSKRICDHATKSKNKSI